jgi:hypothetical protein
LELVYDRDIPQLVEGPHALGRVSGSSPLIATMFEPREIVKKSGWINIYREFRIGRLSTSRGTYSTKELADEAPTPIGCEKVGYTQIEWEENKNGCGCK